MNKRRLTGAGILGAGALLVATTLAFAAPAAVSGAIENPTQQQALDANETVRNYIQQHGDAPTPSPSTTTPAPTTTTTVPSTTTPAPTTTTVAPDPAPSNFRATAGDQQIVLTWAKPSGGTPTGYIYGRDGVDSTGYGAYTSAVLPPTTTTQTLLKLVNGSPYTVFVEAVYSTGNKRVATVATPRTGTPATFTASPSATTASPSATPTTATPSPRPPSTNRPSGLTWNSGVWNDQNPSQTAAFVSGPRGGLNVDNVLVYTSRQNQAAQNAPASWKAGLPADFNGINQDLVLAVTTWTADGAFMTAAQAKAIGTSMCSVDSMHPIARIDWEMNLNDGAGANGAALTSSNYSAWVARFRLVAQNIKGACPSALVDFNPNVGRDQTPGCNPGTLAQMCSRRAFQEVKDVVDIYGIDTYDSYPPVKADSSGWSARLNSDNGLDESRRYAVANGKKWSVPEWGVACNVGGCQWQGNAGGDDPQYVHLMVAYFADHAADMAYETYFNEPNSYIISDLINNNPNSRAKYRSDLLAQ